MLCKFRHIFGKERQGIHAYRFLDIAIVDLLLTILVAYLISKYWKFKFWIVLLILLVLSVLAHLLFCVKSKFVSLLF
jgi:hypothetical protein